MITRQLQVWLAAEASGDLPPEQSRRIRAYLKRDAEAAAYFASLLADRRRLIGSTRRGVGADLAKAVMAATGSTSINISRASQEPKRQKRRAILAAGIAVAAAILAAVLLIPKPVDRRESVNPAVPQPVVAAAPGQPVPPTEPASPSGTSDAEEPERIDPSGRSNVPEPTERAVNPVVVAPRVETTVAEKQRVIPASTRPNEPLTVDARDLSDPESGRKILIELRRSIDHSLDVTSKDTSRTLEELARILRSRGVPVALDSHVVGPRSRQRQVYAVYTEALYAKEVLEVMRRLAQSPAGDNLAEPVFGHLTIDRVSEESRREMVALLGQDPLLHASPSKRPSEVRITTVDGSVKAKLSNGRPIGATAFVGPVISRPPGKGASREAQQFLERKPEPLTGKLRLWITIRPV